MTIRQTVSFDASPEDVYDALSSASTFAAITGAPADIERAAGGAFSCFGGQITGRQIELVPNERIVQAWRAGPWADGVYSIVRFDLQGTAKSTTLSLEHSGYPDGAGEHLQSGWHKMYWEPLKAYLA